jgi:hypothetical protein
MPDVVAAIKADAAQSPGEPYRVYNEFRIYDNYGVPFAVEDLWGASPLRPDRYDKFLSPPMPVERIWELLNVKYVITWRQELFVPSTIIFEEPAPDGMTYVHRLSEIGPRAWLVNQAEIAGDETILQKIADPNFDRWQTALLEAEARPYLEPINQSPSDQLNQVAKDEATFEGDHAAIGRQAPRIRDQVLHFASPSPHSLTINVSTSVPTLLILSETHYPGWQATIDGRPATILRAYYLLRAVPLPAGEHTVELIFRPLSFTIGAVTSGLSLLFVLGAVILQRRPRRPNR